MLAAQVLTVLAVALAASAAPTSPLDARAAKCSAYTIISTRGTGEVQGPSAGFRTMNTQIQAAVSGGTVYNTVYPAGANQDSSAGTTDIVNKVTSTLASDPSHCFFLEGYSQGAAATVDAMPKLTGSAFTAVRGVYLIGDPRHRPNLACNVDANGGKTTYAARGLEAFQAGIPSNWVSKTKDVCLVGDGVCDTSTGFGITATHLTYGYNSAVQSQGSKFATSVLNGSA